MANPLYNSGPDRYMSSGNADWPGRFATAITPSDTLAVSIGPSTPGAYAKSLYIGVAGDLTIITAGDNSNNGAGTPVLLKAHPVGYCPIQVRAVLAAGTTAQSIVGIAD